jgi:hypothetical protein
MYWRLKVVVGAGLMASVAGCFSDPPVVDGETEGAGTGGTTSSVSNGETTRVSSDSGLTTTNTTQTTQPPTTDSSDTVVDDATTPMTSESTGDTTDGTTGDSSESGMSTVTNSTTESETGGDCEPGGTLPDPPSSCSGTTVGVGDDEFLGCVPSGGEDVSYLFVAPSDDHYVFTTFEGAPLTDTALQVMSEDGTVLGCSQSIGAFDGAQPFYTTGLVHLDLAAGHAVQVVVEHEGGFGDFVVSVGTGTIPGGTCCDATGAQGCSVPEIQSCVSGFDPYCAQTAWDELCVGLALAACDADCF